MKHLSFKKHIEYILDYYRFHALVIIFCIMFFCYFLSPLLAAKKHPLLSFAIIDSTQAAKDDSSALSDDLVSYLNGDTATDVINIDTSGGTYDSSSSSTIKLSILLSSVGENDIIICNKDLYEQYDKNGAFINLNELSDTLSSEALSYISGSACDLSSCSKWIAYGYTDFSPVYLCIPVSCEHPEQAAKAINYFFSGEVK